MKEPRVKLKYQHLITNSFVEVRFHLSRVMCDSKTELRKLSQSICHYVGVKNHFVHSP